MRSKIRLLPSSPREGDRMYCQVFCLIPMRLPVSHDSKYCQWRWLETSYITTVCTQVWSEGPVFARHWSNEATINKLKKEK